MKNILVVGSGAREVAIARKISESSVEHKIFCVSSVQNPQINNLCCDYFICSLDRLNDICNYALKKKIDLVIIGPENPLEGGLVNMLGGAGVACVGPRKEVAMIETSYVIKYDGLMGGKGVKISGDHLSSISDGLKYAQSLVDAGGSFLIEEKLIGEEFSLMSFVDGKTCCHMPVIQDHKRAFDGDVGPNTGGMGTYSFANHSLPFLKKADVLSAQQTNELVVKQLLKETGTPFVGILYGGFMLTKSGVKVIEYNARFGDPEAMNVLSLMKSDFLKVCFDVVGGTLTKESVDFEKMSTVCKYAVPSGYPDKPLKGFVVECDNNNPNIFLASVELVDGRVVACGSRTAAVVGKNIKIADAEKLAENLVCSIGGDLFHRRDIGTKDLLLSRVARMEKILT